MPEHHAQKVPISKAIELPARRDHASAPQCTEAFADLLTPLAQPHGEVHVFSDSDTFIEAAQRLEIATHTPEHAGGYSQRKQEAHQHNAREHYAQRHPFRPYWHPAADELAAPQCLRDFQERVWRHPAVSINGDQHVAGRESSTRVPDARQVSAIFADNNRPTFMGNSLGGVSASVQHNNDLDQAREHDDGCRYGVKACADMRLFIPCRNDNGEVHGTGTSCRLAGFQQYCGRCGYSISSNALTGKQSLDRFLKLIHTEWLQKSGISRTLADRVYPVECITYARAEQEGRELDGLLCAEFASLEVELATIHARHVQVSYDQFPRLALEDVKGSCTICDNRNRTVANVVTQDCLIHVS